jgi:hypothetical protein
MARCALTLWMEYNPNGIEWKEKESNGRISPSQVALMKASFNVQKRKNMQARRSGGADFTSRASSGAKERVGNIESVGRSDASTSIPTSSRAIAQATNPRVCEILKRSRRTLA